MMDEENLDGLTLEGRCDYWRERALSLEQQIQDLKDVGRAKAILMSECGFTEPAAHRYIQKTAMDTRRSMGALARDLIEGLSRPEPR